MIGIERYRELDERDDLHLSDKISSHDSEGEMMRFLMQKFEVKKKAFSGEETRDLHVDLPQVHPFDEWHVKDAVEECEITIPTYGPFIAFSSL